MPSETASQRRLEREHQIISWLRAHMRSMGEDLSRSRSVQDVVGYLVKGSVSPAAESTLWKAAAEVLMKLVTVCEPRAWLALQVDSAVEVRSLHLGDTSIGRRSIVVCSRQRVGDCREDHAHRPCLVLISRLELPNLKPLESWSCTREDLEARREARPPFCHLPCDPNGNGRWASCSRTRPQRFGAC